MQCVPVVILLSSYSHKEEHRGQQEEGVLSITCSKRSNGLLKPPMSAPPMPPIPFFRPASPYLHQEGLLTQANVEIVRLH